MDRVVCWNSAEKTYNPFPHHCFARVVEDRFDPYEGSIFKKSVKIGEIGPFFEKSGNCVSTT